MANIGDLPKFPPAWARIGGGPSKSGLVGHLKYVRLSQSSASLVIIIEEDGAHFIGYYHADPETLRRLHKTMLKGIGRRVVVLAETTLEE